VRLLDGGESAEYSLLVGSWYRGVRKILRGVGERRRWWTGTRREVRRHTRLCIFGIGRHESEA
jgi:hypothetical protein